jgi:hypothetical protein
MLGTIEIKPIGTDTANHNQSLSALFEHLWIAFAPPPWGVKGLFLSDFKSRTSSSVSEVES